MTRYPVISLREAPARPAQSPSWLQSHKAHVGTLAVIACLFAASAVTHKPIRQPEPIRHTASDQRLRAALTRHLTQEDRATLGRMQRSIAMERNDPLPQPPRSPLHKLTHEAATAEGIDPVLFHTLVMAESGGNPNAVSKAGACGLSQLMPKTATTMGVRDCKNPRQNARGGARYLRQNTDQFGSSTLGLVAYNWGPANTDRWLRRGGQWSRLPKETRDYVSKIKVNAALSARGIQLASGGK